LTYSICIGRSFFTAGPLDDRITSLAKRFGNAASQEGFVLDHENDQSSDTVSG